MKVFLLAGQSNMQGFALIAGQPVLRDERICNLATGVARIAEEPLHHWDEHPMPAGVGIGLAMPFALNLLEQDPLLRIGFIPAARGGTSLDDWMPGNPCFERAIQLYERAAGSVAGLELAGILWHQGEADAKYEATANTYGERLSLTLAGFRDRLKSPSAPVIAGELGRFLELNPAFTYHATVVAQTRQVIAATVNARFVSSEGLICDGHHTHFGAASIRTFGVRYAEAYLAVTQAAQLTD